MLLGRQQETGDEEIEETTNLAALITNKPSVLLWRYTSLKIGVSSSCSIQRQWASSLKDLRFNADH